eukprot:TRINITY_DN42348_c0_g1_i1.p1 TRINITY_DN42348_c0_g1~~TRINITY_DN42348_c0_g1_i1.p1  ORF type:complete len:814 (+),score=107.21 TRINITY_DN42348_c0_g1_i1:88-2529(+)
MFWNSILRASTPSATSLERSIDPLSAGRKRKEAKDRQRREQRLQTPTQQLTEWDLLPLEPSDQPNSNAPKSEGGSQNNLSARIPGRSVDAKPDLPQLVGGSHGARHAATPTPASRPVLPTVNHSRPHTAMGNGTDSESSNDDDDGTIRRVSTHVTFLTSLDEQLANRSSLPSRGRSTPSPTRRTTRSRTPPQRHPPAPRTRGTATMPAGTLHHAGFYSDVPRSPGSVSSDSGASSSGGSGLGLRKRLSATGQLVRRSTLARADVMTFQRRATATFALNDSEMAGVLNDMAQSSVDFARYQVLHRVAEAQKRELQRREQRVQERQQKHELAKQEKRNKLRDQRRQEWAVLVAFAVGTERMARLWRTRRARECLEYFFIPAYRFRRWQRHRQLARLFLRQVYRRRMRRPDPESLKATAFFKEWPAWVLKRLARGLTPAVFLPGEYVVTQGDPGRHMFVLDHGSVDVVVKRNDSVSKSRNRKNGIVVATIDSPGSYFGEFAVLAEEPRMASVICNTITCLWVVKKLHLWFWIERLPQRMVTQLYTAADSRRRQNMGKLYPLTVRQIRTSPIFQNWDERVLQQLIAKTTALVYHEGEVIINEMDTDTCLYWIARGRVSVRTATAGSVAALDAPSLFGEISFLFLERRTATCTATMDTEVWRLLKEDFLEIVMLHPQLFISAKREANGIRAVRLPPLPLETLQSSGIVASELHGELRRLHTLLFPRIYDATDTIGELGKPCREIVFLLRGTVRDHHHVEVGAGTCVGFPESLRMPTWQATFKALTRCDCWVLDKAQYLRFIDNLSYNAQAAMVRHTVH